MVKNYKLLERFNNEQIKQAGTIPPRRDSPERRNSYLQNVRIFEELWKEGVELGVLPLKNLMDGIEVDIRIAKILNSQHD